MASAIYIQNGRVRLGILDKCAGSSPKVLLHQLAVVEGPCWLDASSAILNIPSAFDAIAQTDVGLRRVPLTDFQAWLGDCPSGVRSLMIDLARVKHDHDERALMHIAKDALARFAEWLLTQATVGHDGRHTVHLTQSKRDLAAELGVVPETLSRKLLQLRKHQLVSECGRDLVLPDPDRLSAVSRLESTLK